MILSAQSIRERGILTPFSERGVIRGRSYGLSSCGYDIRVEFESGVESVTLDREVYYSRAFDFVLASTMEHFNMPDDVVGIVHDKSSWARQGLTVQNTVIEPGWRGYLTLELAYHGNNKHLVIKRGDPIAQVIFHQLDRPTNQPYVGKYQDQERGPQGVRFENDKA